MIDVTVKTLDSENHTYSVADDFTVKQLKERIANSVGITADKQRLIYCGRVLQDDKKLDEYDVNGKVIHLVQRAPPSQNATSASGTTQAQGSTTTHHHRHRRPAGSDGRAVYLSALAFPTDMIEGEGIHARARIRMGGTFPPFGQSSPQVRLNTAQQMLQKANQVLNRLESHSSNVSTSENNGHEEDSGIENGNNNNNSPSTSTHESESTASAGMPTGNPFIIPTVFPPPQQPPPLPTSGGNLFSGSIAHAAQAATAAAIAAAFSASQAVGAPNVTILQGQPPGGTHGRISFGLQASNSTSGSEDVSRNSGTSTSAASADQSNQSSNPASSEEATSGSGNTGAHTSGIAGGRQAPRVQHPHTSVLADTLNEVNRFNERLAPYLERYHSLMRDDPVLADTAAVRDAQQTFNRISEALHFLSHAYHAISDIIVDFSRTPPRELRAQPFFIQHSAILQAGIPIQTQINVTANPAGNQTASSTASSSATAASSESSSNSTSEEGRAEPAAATHTTSETHSTSASQSFSQSPWGPDLGSHAPRHPVVFMEVGPSTITIDSLSATIVADNDGSNGNNSSSTENSGTQTNFTWGQPPPPEVIQNLMQAMAGQMGPRPTTSNGTGGIASGAQNSQARGNTATNPTTSTQTRSTARPHVHMAPVNMSGFPMNNFDPFLSCNSHHVRMSRRTGLQSRANRQPQDSGSQGEQQFFNFVSSLLSGYSDTPQASATPETQPPAQGPGEGQGTMPQRALDPSLVALMNQLVQQQGNSSTTSSTTSATNSASGTGQSQTSPAVISDEVFTNLVQGVSSQVTGALTGQQQTSTIADFLQTLPNFSYTEEDSLLTELFMVVAQNLTFHDTVGILFGQSEVLNTLQPQLNQFVRRRVMNGEEVNEEAIRQAVSRILVDCVPHIQAAVNDANVREGIDYAATVYNFARQRLCDLVQLVTSPGDVNFASCLMDLCWTSLRELVLLSIHCFSDGLQSLENVFQGRVRSLTEGMNPLIQQWTLNNAFTHLQNLVPNMPMSEEQIHHYVLSCEDGQSIRREWEEKKGEKKEDEQEPKADEEELCAEPMETDTAEPEAKPAGVTTSTAADTQVVENHVDAQGDAESPASSESSSSGAMAMETDDLPDVVFGSESWHHAVPLDWVPILVRDSQKMRRQPTLQAPLSDAYLSTMPPKRRKVATAKKPQAELSTVISESLRQAITTVGAQPAADLNHVLKEAGETPSIQKAYQEQMRKCVNDRLKTDVDYKPEKYPNVEKYFRK